MHLSSQVNTFTRRYLIHTKNPNGRTFPSRKGKRHVGARKSNKQNCHNTLQVKCTSIKTQSWHIKTMNARRLSLVHAERQAGATEPDDLPPLHKNIEMPMPFSKTRRSFFFLFFWFDRHLGVYMSCPQCIGEKTQQTAPKGPVQGWTKPVHTANQLKQDWKT